jgi:hypothetical protein
VVAKLARLDKVSDSKERAEKNADSCNDDVGDSKEGVFATHHGAGADEDSLRAAILGNVEVWVVLDIVLE